MVFHQCQAVQFRHQNNDARQMIPPSGDSAPTVMDTGVCPGAEEAHSRVPVTASRPKQCVDSHEAMLHRVRERIRAQVVESGSDTDSVDFGRELGDEGSVASGEEEPPLMEEVVEVQEDRTTPTFREAFEVGRGQP